MAEDTFHGAIPTRVRRELLIDSADSSTLAGSCGNLAFVVTRGQGRRNTVRKRTRMLEELSAENPAGFFFLNVVPDGAAMPDEDARAISRTVNQRFAGRFIAQAIVLEGSGVWLNSMRLVARTMLLAIPSAHPRKVFESVEDAVAWFVTTAPDQDGFGAISSRSSPSITEV